MSESLRQERWHEVYMTVLKAQLTPTYGAQYMTLDCGVYPALDPTTAHDRAKATADKAYPAPLTPVDAPPIVEDLDGLGLSVRVHNALHHAGIKSRAQVFAMSDWELLRLPGMGRKAIKEIRKAMAPPP